MADSNNSTTVISADTSINGEVTFSSPARIMGRIDGKIVSKDTVQIAKGATCAAQIDAERVVVEGQVEGNVTARERVELMPASSLKGEINAANLIVQDGATLVAQCRIGPDASKGGGGGSGAKGQVETKPGAAKPVGAKS